MLPTTPLHRHQLGLIHSHVTISVSVEPGLPLVVVLPPKLPRRAEELPGKPRLEPAADAGPQSLDLVLVIDHRPMLEDARGDQRSRVPQREGQRLALRGGEHLVVPVRRDVQAVPLLRLRDHTRR